MVQIQIVALNFNSFSKQWSRRCPLPPSTPPLPQSLPTPQDRFILTQGHTGLITASLPPLLLPLLLPNSCTSSALARFAGARCACLQRRVRQAVPVPLNNTCGFQFPYSLSLHPIFLMVNDPTYTAANTHALTLPTAAAPTVAYAVNLSETCRVQSGRCYPLVASKPTSKHCYPPFQD